MEIDYTGYVDDELVTDIVERILEKYGVKKNKKKISRQVLEGIEDFFIESAY